MELLAIGDLGGCGIAGAAVATTGIAAVNGLAGGMISLLLRRCYPALSPAYR